MLGQLTDWRYTYTFSLQLHLGTTTFVTDCTSISLIMFKFMRRYHYIIPRKTLRLIAFGTLLILYLGFGQYQYIRISAARSNTTSSLQLTLLDIRSAVISEGMSFYPKSNVAPLLQFNFSGSILYQLQSPKTFNDTWVKEFSHELYTQHRKTPVILRWIANDRKSSISYKAGHGYLKNKYNCPVSNCIYTDDSSRYLEADAIVFMRSLHQKVPTFPPKRLPHQRYIFHHMESPVHPIFSNLLHSGNAYRSFFNWTATYRLDSDIHRPYSLFIKKDVTTKPIMNNHVMSRKKKGIKLVAWFVSHCKTGSRREEYVKELQRYMEVDIYGKCGTLKCERSSSYCYKNILPHYWFYLSFENAICLDYLTEKVILPMKDAYVVPVVFGGANYTKLLPPHSFIDITQFVSPKALAEYLIALTEDEDRYAAYFDWTGQYSIEVLQNRHLICQICSRLHERPLTGQVYTDFTSWFSNGMCDTSWVKRNKAFW